MQESALPNPLATARATIQSIDAALLRYGLLPSGMEDLKSAIDDVRLRLWAMISASSASDPDGVLLRFRLRRAQEICRSVLADLDSDDPGAHQRELTELRDAASRMVERITAVVRGSG